MQDDDTARAGTEVAGHANTAIADAATAGTEFAAMASEASSVTGPVPLSKRYEVGRVIGRGGMGEVISAKDDDIGRNVAIKRIRGTADAKTTARFLREARIQGQLEHPSIVPVYELSTDHAGQPFFAMKQLAGATLADVITIARDNPKPPAKYSRRFLLQAFTQICLAIELAHTRRIIHRDLKPANVMLGDFGEVYVLDWGIAKLLGDAEDITDASSGDASDHTVIGSTIGTPGYMSPEQVDGDPTLDGRADVYALGCVLFEILALEPLLPRGAAGLAAAKAGVDARPSLRAPEREIPPELDRICEAACQVDRAKRPSTARELGERVQHYLDGDRDLALRKELAAKELAAARALLEGGLLETMSESRQRLVPRGLKRNEVVPFVAAVRAANRALALDASSREAAQLVGRLMLEPPVETPHEVETELAKQETELIVRHARIGIWSVIGYLIFFPVMWFGGIREHWLVFGGATLTLGIMALLFLVTRRPSPVMIFASFLSQVALVVLYARGMSPLLVAPGVALVTALMYATHIRTGPVWLLWVCCAGGVVVPLAIEAFGMVAPTTTVGGSNLTIHLPAENIDQTVAFVGLGGYVCVILLAAAILSRLQAVERRTIMRKVQLQAWQLAQLIPKA